MAVYQYIAGDMRIKQYDKDGNLILKADGTPDYYQDPNTKAYPNTVRIYADEDDALKYIEEGLLEYRADGNHVQQKSYATLSNSAFQGHDDVNWVIFCGGPSGNAISVPKNCFLRSHVDTIRYQVYQQDDIKYYPVISELGKHSFQNSDLKNVTLWANMGQLGKEKTLVLGKKCFCNNADTLDNITLISDGNISLETACVGRTVGFNRPSLDNMVITCNNLSWVRGWGENLTADSIGLANLTLNVKSTTQKSTSGITTLFRGGARLSTIVINGGVIDNMFEEYEDNESYYGDDSGVKTKKLQVNITQQNPITLANCSISVEESFEIHFPTTDLSNTTTLLTIGNNFNAGYINTDTGNKIYIYNDTEGKKWFSKLVKFDTSDYQGFFGTRKYSINFIDSSDTLDLSQVDFNNITGQFRYLNNVSSTDFSNVPCASLPDGAFIGSDITAFKVNAETKLVSIGTKAFYNCSGLTSFIAPNVDEELIIHNYAFQKCVGLTTLQIGPKRIWYDRPLQITLASIQAKKIGFASFSGCHKLSDLYLDKSIQIIDDEAFGDCKWLSRLFWNCLIEGQDICKITEGAKEPSGYQGVFPYLGHENSCHFYIGPDVTKLPKKLFYGSNNYSEKYKRSPCIIDIVPFAFDGSNNIIIDSTGPSQSKLVEFSESCFQDVNMHASDYEGVTVNFSSGKFFKSFPKVTCLRKHCFDNTRGLASLQFSPVLEVIEEYAFGASSREKGFFHIEEIKDYFPYSLKYVSPKIFGDICETWGMQLKNETSEAWRYKGKLFNRGDNYTCALAERGENYRSGPFLVIMDEGLDYWLLTASNAQNTYDKIVLDFTQTDSFTITNKYHNIRGICDQAFVSTYITCDANGQVILPKKIQSIQEGAFQTKFGISLPESANPNSPRTFVFCKDEDEDEELYKKLYLGPEALSGQGGVKKNHKTHYKNVPIISEMAVSGIVLHKDDILEFENERALESWLSMATISNIAYGSIATLTAWNNEEIYKCREPGWILKCGDKKIIDTLCFGDYYYNFEQVQESYTIYPEDNVTCTLNPGSCVGLMLTNLYIDLTQFSAPQTQGTETDFFSKPNNLIVFGNYQAPAQPENQTKDDSNFLAIICDKGYEEETFSTWKTTRLFGSGMVSKLTELKIPAYGYDTWWFQHTYTSGESKGKIIPERMFEIKWFYLYFDEATGNDSELYTLVNENAGKLSLNNLTLEDLILPYLGHIIDGAPTLRSSPILNFYNLQSDGTISETDFSALASISMFRMNNIPDTCFAKLSNCVICNFIHPQMQTIGKEAFQDCFSLTEIYLSKDLIRIGSDAFSNCTSLNWVQYGGSVAEWYQVQFENLAASPFNALDKDVSRYFLYYNEEAKKFYYATHPKITVGEKEGYKDGNYVTYDPRPFYNYPVEELIFTKPYSFSLPNQAESDIKFIVGTEDQQTTHFLHSYIDALGSIKILRFQQLSKNKPIYKHLFKIQNGEDESEWEDFDFTNLQYIIYEPSGSAEELGDYALTIPEDCFSNLSNGEKTNRILCIPDNIRYINKNAFNNCQCLIRQLDGPLRTEGVINADAYAPLTFGSLIKSDCAGFITTNTNNYIIAEDKIAVYNNDIFNFCIGTKEFVQSINLENNSQHIFNGVSETLNLRAIDLGSITVSDDNESFSEIILPWLGTCNDRTLTKEASCTMGSLFNNAAITKINTLIITNDELYNRFNVVTSDTEASVPVFNNVAISRLVLKGKCLTGDTEDNTADLLAQQALFDADNTRLDWCILQMNIIPENLLSVTDNLKSIEKLVIEPYSTDAKQIKIKTASLKTPTIDQILINVPTSKTYYKDLGLDIETSMPIVFEEGVINSNLNNQFIYYSGSLKHWAVSNQFANDTANPLKATKKLYTNVQFDPTNDYAIVSKEFENAFQPYYIVTEDTDLDLTYYKYLVNNYAFYGNHQINSVDCYSDDAQLGARISLTPVTKLTEFSEEPFGASSALIEMFAGSNDISMNGVNVNTKSEYLKVGDKFKESEVVLKDNYDITVKVL